MPFVARLAMMHRCDAVGRAVCGGPGAVLCCRGVYHLDAVWVCCRGASCRRDDALPRCVMPSRRCAAAMRHAGEYAKRAPGAHPVMTVRIRFLSAVVQSRCFPGCWQMNRCRC